MYVPARLGNVLYRYVVNNLAMFAVQLVYKPQKKEAEVHGNTEYKANTRVMSQWGMTCHPE